METTPNQRHVDIFEALASGQIRKNSWGWAVSEYLLDHPEEGEEMALHHYRSFLAKKCEMMLQDILMGRHIGQIAVHKLMRSQMRVIKAN